MVLVFSTFSSILGPPHLLQEFDRVRYEWLVSFPLLPVPVVQ